MANEQPSSAQEFRDLEARMQDWMNNNQSLRGTPKYAEARALRDELQANGNQFRTAEDSVLSVKNLADPARFYEANVQSMADTMGRLTPEAIGETAKTMGIKGGSMAAGQVVGAIGGRAMGQRSGQPWLEKAGASLGGAVAGGIGSVVDQLRRGDGVKLGETLADINAGANVARNPLIAGMGGATSEAVRQFVDEGNINYKNVALAGGLAAGAARVANKTTTDVPVAGSALQGERKRVFEDLRGEGVVINPIDLQREGSFLSQVAGASSLTSGSSNANQSVWQKLIREQAGLSKEAKPLVPDRINPKTGAVVQEGELTKRISIESRPFEELKAQSRLAQEELNAYRAGNKARWADSPSFATAMETDEAKDLLLTASVNYDQMRILREDLVKMQRALDSTGSELQALNRTEIRAQIAAGKERLGMLEDKLQQAANIWGVGDLPQRINDARQMVGQLYTIKGATSEATGLVDPVKIWQAKQNGAFLTGNLRRIADFTESFQNSAKPMLDIPLGGLQTEQSTSYVARNIGKPQAVLSALTPSLRENATNYLLSPKAQEGLMQTQMQPGSMPALSAAGKSTFLVGGREIGAANREQNRQNGGR